MSDTATGGEPEDGSHICKISAETLAIARQALEPSHDQ